MLPYIFLQQIALPYRVMVPIETCLMMIVLGQRFYYDGFKKSLAFNIAIFASFVGILSMMVFASSSPQLVADIAGWGSFVAFTINPLPQILKIFRNKSTFGFSFWFASFSAAAQVFELVGGVLEHVPLPTIAMAVRGLFVYVFYVFFFICYRTRP